VNSKNKRGETLLHLAAFRGAPAIVRILLAAGADVNAIDYQGEMPLYYVKRLNNERGACIDLLTVASGKEAIYKGNLYGFLGSLFLLQTQ
jgi:ankyrin repeat protein